MSLKYYVSMKSQKKNKIKRNISLKLAKYRFLSVISNIHVLLGSSLEETTLQN